MFVEADGLLGECHRSAIPLSLLDSLAERRTSRTKRHLDVVTPFGDWRVLRIGGRLLTLAIGALCSVYMALLSACTNTFQVPRVSVLRFAWN